MKKEIKVIDKEKGIMRITTVDERWYAKQAIETKTGLPVVEYLPSSSYIAGCYPKGEHFWRWLANTGWAESERIKSEAGDKGTKVHHATEDIEKGIEIDIQEAKYANSSDVESPLTPEEVEGVMSFIKVFDLLKPQVLATELTVFGKFYAGTLDSIWRIPQTVKINNYCKISKGIWIIDKKTSKNVWPSHEIQVSSYSQADIDYKSLGITVDEWIERKLAILQLGYPRTKDGFKFNIIEDKYSLFLNAYEIWKNENPDAKPKQRDFPLILKAEHSGR